MKSQKAKVLVVDANPHNIYAAQRQLGDKYQVSIRATFADALLAFKSTASYYDIILIDPYLPRCRGEDGLYGVILALCALSLPTTKLVGLLYGNPRDTSATIEALKHVPTMSVGATKLITSSDPAFIKKYVPEDLQNPLKADDDNPAAIMVKDWMSFITHVLSS
jgi:CheY-like chemotaxis protein